MQRLEARVTALERGRSASVKDLTTHELEQLLVQELGYLPDDAELARLAAGEAHHATP